MHRDPRNSVVISDLMVTARTRNLLKVSKFWGHAIVGVGAQRRENESGQDNQHYSDSMASYDMLIFAKYIIIDSPIILCIHQCPMTTVKESQPNIAVPYIRPTI